MTTRAAKPASKQAQPRKAVAARKAPSRSTPASVDVDLDAIENDVHPSFTFKLGGQTFRCRNRDDLHWDTIEKWMIERATGDANKIAVVIDDFYRAVLFPEDVEAFLALKADPKGPLTAARQNTLLRETNARVLGMDVAVDPTNAPSSSAGGSRKTGSTSKAKSAAKRGGRSAA